MRPRGTLTTVATAEEINHMMAPMARASTAVDPALIAADAPDPDTARWIAVVQRDRSADGTFVYAVVTTGIYCRPSCAARQPRRSNVTFHSGPKAAKQAGFRACRRCRPNQTDPAEDRVALIAEACRMIDGAEESVPLDAMAAAAGLSPSHFHRLFKATTGLTPRGYAAALKAQRLRSTLDHAATVTAAIYDAGYSSSSRFYDHSDAVLGMTPKTYRAGGAATEICFATGQCSLGAILVAATAKGVCDIALGDDPDALLRSLQDRFPLATLSGGERDFEAIVAAVIGFVDAPDPAGPSIDGHALPLDIRGTAFQQLVWTALRQILPGRTASYAEIAAVIGAPDAVRAVAGACAANRLAVVIPCHRVVRTDGTLSGYRWGVERKRTLLKIEAASRR